MEDVLAELRTIQTSGNFAQPYLCNVGAAMNQGYFGVISKLFAGSYHQTNTVEEFFKGISMEMSSLLRAKKVFVLTMNGLLITIRQADDRPGLYTTSHIVHHANQIISNGVQMTVNTTPPLLPPEETKEEATSGSLALEDREEETRGATSVDRLGDKDLDPALIDIIHTLSPQEKRDLLKQTKKKSWLDNCTIS